MTKTLPHLSRRGVDTATKPLLNVIKLPVTVFLYTSTKSWYTSHTRRNALMTKCINDTLLWVDDIQSSFFQAVEWLDICGRNVHGIILNPDKFVFCQHTVSFAGLDITPSHVRPNQNYLDAIRNFPKPQNITDMRSWFGLINQVAYAFASAEHMLPFREALKQDLEKLFEESKTAIIQEIENGVRIFDKSKPTCLATGWSKHGIGYWLFQKHCDCTPVKPFCCRTG